MSKVVLTFDLDWCLDSILEYTIKKLTKNKVPATFFVTHYSPLLDYMKNIEYFELGIHPNFRVGSTHGDTEDKVIEHCLKIVPHAVSSRSHGCEISSNKLASLMNNGIQIDCSTFTPNIESLQHSWFRMHNKSIFRISYNWEDDYEFYQKNKKYQFFDIQGWPDKILDFHPVHVYLNSNRLVPPLNLKKTSQIVEKKGVETMLDEVIENYIRGDIKIVSLKDYVRDL